ncbi:MAG: glycoside hydrolase [Actinomycetota bacterium]|nr:glycoside hydrolase [Actinomycetota bacterium]
MDMNKARVLLVAGMAATLTAPAVLSGAAGAATVSAPTCTTARSSAANVDTLCKVSGSNNFETAIAVNPTNPKNIVGASIELFRPPGGGFGSLVTHPHVSFDGGKTWKTYDLDYGQGNAAVDPSVAFDAAGTVYLATTRSGGSSDIVVAHSVDGGRTWSTPVAVVSNRGLRVFHDHPQLAAFGTGNVIVTWIKDIFGPDPVLDSAPVEDSVSHDGGVTWSEPVRISGRAPFCQGLQGGDACDQTFGNSVAVTTAGAVVTFQQTDDEAPDAGGALGRNKYLAVTVDPATGNKTGGPYLIGQAYDGLNEHDYPMSAGGSQTVHDSQFNLDGEGNVTADPADPSGLHLAVVWYDDRNAPHPVDPDPYKAVTDADIVVSQTYDGGRTWSAPITMNRRHEHIMPWAAYDAHGVLHVGFFDRIYDPANHKYGFTLATERNPGSLQFSYRRVSTALSDPTRDNLASRGTIDPAFPFPAVSIGDYPGIAIAPNAVLVYWTDLRNDACIADRCGHRQDSYFARVPNP